jgi:formiminotetrahydrofolate cyclodeaminase
LINLRTLSEADFTGKTEREASGMLKEVNDACERIARRVEEHIRKG